MLTLCLRVLNFAHMSEVSELVGSVEFKVNRLLEEMEILKQLNQKLKAELTSLNDEKSDLEKIISDWEGKYHSLKLANSLLGSNQNTTEAKLKINALIREIDQCITQLSE